MIFLFNFFGLPKESRSFGCPPPKSVTALVPRRLTDDDHVVVARSRDGLRHSVHARPPARVFVRRTRVSFGHAGLRDGGTTSVSFAPPLSREELPLRSRRHRSRSNETVFARIVLHNAIYTRSPQTKVREIGAVRRARPRRPKRISNGGMKSAPQLTGGDDRPESIRGHPERGPEQVETEPPNGCRFAPKPKTPRFFHINSRGRAPLHPNDRLQPCTVCNSIAAPGRAKGPRRIRRRFCPSRDASVDGIGLPATVPSSGRGSSRKKKGGSKTN